MIKGNLKKIKNEEKIRQKEKRKVDYNVPG